MAPRSVWWLERPPTALGERESQLRLIKGVKGIYYLISRCSLCVASLGPLVLEISPRVLVAGRLVRATETKRTSIRVSVPKLWKVRPWIFRYSMMLAEREEVDSELDAVSELGLGYLGFSRLDGWPTRHPPGQNQHCCRGPRGLGPAVDISENSETLMAFTVVGRTTAIPSVAGGSPGGDTGDGVGGDCVVPTAGLSLAGGRAGVSPDEAIPIGKRAKTQRRGDIRRQA